MLDLQFRRGSTPNDFAKDSRSSVDRFHSGMPARLLKALVFLLLTTRGVIASTEYEIHGTAKASIFGTAAVEEYQFAVYVRDQQWAIVLNPKSAPHMTLSSGSENGKDVYLVRLNNTNGQSMVQVEPTSFPTGYGTPALTHLWFMYASAPFLEHFERTNTVPIYKYAYVLRGDSRDPRPQFWRDNLELSLNDGFPKLPAAAAFLNSGFMDIVNITTLVKGNTNAPTPAMAPFDKGYVSAIYTAEDYQEVGKLRIPSKVTFKWFAIGSAQTTNEMPVRASFEALADIGDPLWQEH
jgi:hypothetical protein